MSAAAELADLLQLRAQAVAIAFRDSPPDGISRIDDVAPSGCTYWKYAAAGRSFYTEASDHFGCPIGAYTHGVELPEQQSEELQQLIGTMVDLEYLGSEEVEGIPRRAESFGVVIYAPLDTAAFEPDVVLVAGNAKQMMLIAEAANRSGVAGDASTMGRPTCAAIPAVMQSGGAVTNLGCIGNRVYTELSDDELYYIFAGDHLEKIVEKLKTIVNANCELEKFHSARV